MTESTVAASYVPDLMGVSVLICTPCMTGQYDTRFMKSFHRTIKEIERFGGTADLAEVMYCADIALARSKLLGVFYRSKYTHMMWIDSDMGFREQDVVRLILRKRDFIGGVGPKKLYPIQFAASKTEPDGTPIVLELDHNTGLTEVNEVGMAFMLLSRHCVESMIEAYQDLSYFGDEAGLELDYALFDPTITPNTPRRRLSEDYAFCRRWRNIGGKIEIMPDILLNHTGMHTFTGAFSQLFGFAQDAVFQPGPAPESAT